MTLAAPALDRPARVAPRRWLGAAVLRVLVVIGLYAAYAMARNAHGAATSPEDYGLAKAHAEQLVALQDAVGLPSEVVLQRLVLDATWLVKAFGAYYGSAHFLVTLGALIVLAWRRPRLFDRWGGALALTTALAVLVFAAYPVAPPRLMPPGQATVDTLAVVGGVWAYDHGVLERISDPFAALPSLHLAWATWVALALWCSRALGGSRLVGLLLLAHPVLTLVSVFVTGNHWYVDALAGIVLVLLVALGQAWWRARREVGLSPRAVEVPAQAAGPRPLRR